MSPFWQQLVTTFAPILTAVVAISAILATRATGRATIEKDVTIKVWEKRTEAYQELIQAISDGHPRRGHSTAKGMSDAISSGKSARVLPVDIQSDQWKQLETKVAIYASPNVASLFAYWKFTLAGWSWNRMALVFNHARPDETEFDFEEGKQNEQESVASLDLLQEEILLHIRAELDFRARKMPQIRVRRGNIDGFQAILMSGREPSYGLESLVNRNSFLITDARPQESGITFMTYADVNLFGSFGDDEAESRHDGQ